MAVPGSPVLEIPEAVEAARALRRELGVTVEDPLPCVLSLAEDHVGLDVVVAPLPEGWSGFYLPRARRGLVAVNSTHAVVRQRFTIAHELGHHVLAHGPAPRVVALAETPSAVEVAPAPAIGPADHEDAPRGEGGAAVAPEPDQGPDASGTTTVGSAPAEPRKTREPRERAADAFAAELLCPAPAARSFVDRYAEAGPGGDATIDFDLVVRLSCAFGLSAWAVLVRLGTAGILDRGAVRDALQARVNAAEHIPRYRELGLRALSDELELVATGGLPRMPEGINGELLLAVVDPARSPESLPEPMRELRRMLGLDAGPA